MKLLSEAELEEEVESILMHFCEEAVRGDPEKELTRSTSIVYDLINSQKIAHGDMVIGENVVGGSDADIMNMILENQRKRNTL